MKKNLLFLFISLSITLISYSQVANQPGDLVVCDDGGNDGIAQFDLTIQDAQILGSQTGSYITYHFTQADADTANNPIVNPSNFINSSNPQEIYVRLEDANTGSYDTTSFIIQVIPLPTLIQPTPLEICDDGSYDGISVFDLTIKDPEIAAGISDLSVSYHELQVDADFGTNAINPANAYQNLVNPQTLFVRVTDSNTGCVGFTTLTIIVNGLPTNFSLENTYSICDGQAITLDSGLDAANYSFQWSTGETASSIEVTQVGTYTLSVIDIIFGCSNTFATQVFLIDCTDTDLDGVIDADEDLNNNNDLTDDDTDGDTIPNYIDDDDDGDNVDTIIEINIATGRLNNAQHNFVDTDNDLIENYLDDDDDGDNVLTIDEDYNNNGDPTDDDTNMNSIPDYLDGGVALGVQNFNQATFNMYPNPAKNEVNISIPNSSNELVKVSIMDLQGKVVIIKEETTNNSKINLDVSSLSSGVYFMEINLNTVKEIRKLIIE